MAREIRATFEEGPPFHEIGSYRAELSGRYVLGVDDEFKIRRLGDFGFNAHRLENPKNWLRVRVEAVIHEGGHKWLYRLSLLSDSEECTDERQLNLF